MAAAARADMNTRAQTQAALAHMAAMLPEWTAHLRHPAEFSFTAVSSLQENTRGEEEASGEGCADIRIKQHGTLNIGDREASERNGFPGSGNNPFHIHGVAFTLFRFHIPDCSV
jgi:hypothetical protein